MRTTSAPWQLSRPDTSRYPRKSMRALRLTVIAASVALAFDGTCAFAAPQGGVVQAGAAQIVHTTPTRLDIIQSTNRAIINWQSFGIAASEHVNFQQPSVQSAMLNRVIGVDPSVILGRLTANGTVFLVNANGVLFGPGSKIDVGSLIATTAGISNENFMAGRYRFDQITNRFATVINRGEITAAEGGLVALVAPGVENTGIIRANLGKVVLASGHAFTLDLFGDKLIALAIDDKVVERLTDPEGRPLTAYVNQAGTIEADGGTVLLTAHAAKTILDNVINSSGTIQARSFAQHGGEIVLYGGDEGTVRVSGVLDASGQHAGERGGSVRVLGENVQLASTAKVNVSGDAGGGSALVGGDWQGGGTTPRATNATVEAGARISADALTSGNGGQVVVWAQGGTRFAGEISTRGGAQSGNGGNVEVSGKGMLSFTGLVDAAAPNGKAGTLLLDPTDWMIRTTEANNFSRTLRQGTNVTVQADRDIEVNESIDGRGGSGGASLALSAGNQIRLNNDLLTNNGAIAVTAGSGGVQMGLGSRATSNQGAVIFAGTEPITINAVGSISAQHLITTGAVNLTTTGANANVVLNQDLNGLANAPLGSLAIGASGGIQAKGLTATGGATLSAGQGIALAPSSQNSFAAGAINAHAAGDITINGDLVAQGAATLTSTDGAITMGAGGVNGTSSIASSSGGEIALRSAQKLAVGHLLTIGPVRIESTADTVQLTKPLLGAKDTNGIGPLTIRTAADLTIDQPIKSTGGIDIQAGGADATSSRALVVAVGTANRLEANAGASANNQPILLGGKSVAITSGEVHSNGGTINITAINGGALVGGSIEEKEFGRFEIPRTAGLFANSGDITIHATERVDLAQLSLTGHLMVGSERGSIFIDSDLGGDLVDVSTNTRTPRPVGSVTLAAGGTYDQKRFYYGGPFNGDTGVVTAPDVVRTGPVAVRVRGIEANGPVAIQGPSTSGEILLDGIIEAKGNVAFDAPAIRARHSVFAEGGNITVGGKLIVEPWGDEIAVELGGGGTTTVASSSFPNARTDSAAPGSALTAAPASRAAKLDFQFHCKEPCGDDLASSQITFRATRVGSAGGQITLTSGAGREEGITDDLAAMRRDQQQVRLDRGAVTKSLFSTDTDDTNGAFETDTEPRGQPAEVARDRSPLALVPFNDVRLNLQVAVGVVFKAASQADDPANKTFRFFGVPNSTESDATPPFNNPVFRLTVLDSSGSLVPGLDVDGTPLPSTSPATFHVDGATAPAQSFSGSLQSYNGFNAPSGFGDSTPADGVRGALFASERHEITGQPPPPGPTSGGQSGAGFPEIFVQTRPGGGNAGFGGEAAGLGNLGGPRALGPGDGSSATTANQTAAQSQAAGLTERFEREEDVPIDLGVARYADLGRLQPASGAAPDVFGQSASLIANRSELPTTADRDYFGRGVFEYLDSNSRRKRRPTQ